MSQSAVCELGNVRDTAACRAWVCKKLVGDYRRIENNLVRNNQNKSAEVFM